eukprot:s2679_g4.t1
MMVNDGDGDDGGNFGDNDGDGDDGGSYGDSDGDGDDGGNYGENDGDGDGDGGVNYGDNDGDGDDGGNYGDNDGDDDGGNYGDNDGGGDGDGDDDDDDDGDDDDDDDRGVIAVAQVMEGMRHRRLYEESSEGQHGGARPGIDSRREDHENGQAFPSSSSAFSAEKNHPGEQRIDLQGAFITEPESFSWEESSWISLVEQSITSSIEERVTLICELKQVLEAALLERSEWQRKVKTMRHFRVPPEPRHWHESVTSALTWRTREVEGLRKEIKQLEMRQRAERRDVCHLRARQKRTWFPWHHIRPFLTVSFRFRFLFPAQGSWCSRSTLHSGFSCSLNSMPSMPSTSSEMRRTNSRAAKPTKGLGRELHVILDERKDGKTLGALGKAKLGTPEVRPLGGLCARAHRAGKQVHVWGWEPGDYCFRDETVANASFTLPDVPRLGYREAIFEAQLLHEVMDG